MSPKKNRTAEPRLRAFWYELLRIPTKLVWSLGYWVRYSGQQNIPPEGGVVVVSNHQSHFDPPLVGAGCRRRMNYLARASLFGFAPFRWLIQSLDAIPLDIEGIGLSGIKETLRRLRRGEMVLMFPEGSRTWDGEVGPFRPGFTALAVRGRASILPVALEGAFDAWPRWRRLPRLGVMHVHYGAPIAADELQAYDEDELIAETRSRVLECLAVLRRRPAFPRCRRRARRGVPRPADELSRPEHIPQGHS
jgi:1-acyl-sn-glycerol-3-phosphate acyltransferase